VQPCKTFEQNNHKAKFALAKKSLSTSSRCGLNETIKTNNESAISPHRDHLAGQGTKWGSIILLSIAMVEHSICNNEANTHHWFLVSVKSHQTTNHLRAYFAQWSLGCGYEKATLNRRIQFRQNRVSMN
jgi:hypothetical protein